MEKLTTVMLPLGFYSKIQTTKYFSELYLVLQQILPFWIPEHIFLCKAECVALIFSEFEKGERLPHTQLTNEKTYALKKCLLIPPRTVFSRRGGGREFSLCPSPALYYTIKENQQEDGALSTQMDNNNTVYSQGRGPDSPKLSAG